MWIYYKELAHGIMRAVMFKVRRAGWQAAASGRASVLQS